MRMPSLPWRRDESVPPKPPKPELPPEEELKGCWRIFSYLAAVIIVIVLGILVYRFAFVWQPWKGAADRAREAETELLAGLPAQTPDITGLSLIDGLFVLSQAGYPTIQLFTKDQHAVTAPEFAGNPGLAVTMTRPAAGEPSSFTVTVWVGDRWEVPEGVDEEAWWFPHDEIIKGGGTYQCLACHQTEFCGTCHEERLRGPDSPFLVEPEETPGLATAVSDAIDVDPTHVLAVYQGIGWFRVDVLLDEPDDVGVVAQAALDAAVVAFPAAFASDPRIEVLTLRWVDAGTLDPIVEIGLERTTFEDIPWMTIESSNIPWIVDRYVVVRKEE